MNDFDYDILQKKQLAKQAKYRKRGSKSKKCTLTSDYLTNKQWKERNGKTVSYSMSKPMSWEVFKLLGKDTQKEYLGSLINKYNANITSLSLMFNICRKTLTRYLDERDLGLSFSAGHSMTVKQREIWDRFISSEPQVLTEANKEEEGQEIEEKADFYEKKRGRDDEENSNSIMSMSKFSISFDGEIDVYAITNSLINIIGGRSLKGSVEVICHF